MKIWSRVEVDSLQNTLSWEIAAALLHPLKNTVMLPWYMTKKHGITMVHFGTLLSEKENILLLNLLYLSP